MCEADKTIVTQICRNNTNNGMLPLHLLLIARRFTSNTSAVADATWSTERIPMVCDCRVMVRVGVGVRVGVRVRVRVREWVSERDMNMSLYILLQLASMMLEVRVHMT
jgi:hypothetical protein